MNAFEELRQQIKQDVTDEMGERALNQTLLTRLLVYLGGKFKETDPDSELVSIMRDWQKSHELRERERFSVEDYFKGRGPVGRRLTEMVRLNQSIAGPNKIGPQMKALFIEALEPFHIPIFKDPRATHELHHLIQTISRRMYGQPAKLRVPSIPLHMGDILAEHRVSNFHQVSAQDTVTREPYSTIMLFAQIGTAWVCLDVRSTGRTQLMYYHPAEDVWLFSDGEYVLFRMVAHLRGEWERLEQQIADKLPKTNTSLPEMMVQLQVKVDKVFDNEDKIPADARHFFRDEQLPVSRVMMRIGDLQVNFINTRGHYPSRVMYMIRGVEDVLSTRVQLEELSPLLQKQVIDAVEDVFDGYINGYIESKPKDETPDQPFKFQNPVFNMYFGHRSKGE